MSAQRPPAGDLESLLEPRYRVVRLPVYGVEERGPREFNTIADRLGEVGQILIHSPRAIPLRCAMARRRHREWSGVVHCHLARCGRAFRSASRYLEGDSLTARRTVALSDVSKGRDEIASSVHKIRGFHRPGDSRQAKLAGTM